MRSSPMLACLVLVLAGLPGDAAAQRRSWPAPAASSHAIEEAVITGIGVATTALVLPTDAKVRNWAVSDPTTHLPIHKLNSVFGPMGGHLPVLGAAGVALVGAAVGKDELRDAGLMTAESIVGSMVVKGVIARVAGRGRPGLEPHDPGDWHLLGGMKGGRDHRSFPSGHAANSFALATAIVEELHHLDSPAYPWAAGVLYTAATATSFTRILDDEHWLSDVIAGIAVGSVTSAFVADWNDR